MFKLVRRGIQANLGRLFLTLISVVLGVAFVSGSFVLADSLRSIFNNISETAFAGVDAQVRAIPPEIGDDAPGGAIPLRFDDSIAAAVQDLPEVEYAEAGIFAFEQVYSVKSDGAINRPTGPPVFTTSWGGPSPVNSFTLIEGEAPVGQQVTLDLTQAEAGGFLVGDMIELALPTGEPEEFELVGTVEFDGGAGAYFIMFDLPTTQRVLNLAGEVDSIVVNAADGVSDDQLVEAITPLLPAGLEAVPGETVIGESQESFGSIIGIFGNILLGFAGVVLFVSIFIIYNTFAILVGQRTKQLGLLRSIGASSTQIRTMVLIEAVIIGIIASVIGLFGGIGVAALLKLLFSQGGAGFPDGPLQILPRTIVVVMIVGMFVTIVSALIPAFRAARVSPLEAIRDGGVKERSLKFRLVAGAAVLIPGLLSLGFGMFGDSGGTSSTLSSIASGAALTFLGVAMLSALFSGPVANFLGQPKVLGPLGVLLGGLALFSGIRSLTNGGLGFVTGPLLVVFGLLALAQAVRVFKAISVGASGTKSEGLTLLGLGRDNASRNPQRTSATATALMIGLALITGVAVLTASLLATFDDLLEDALTAELFIYEEAQGLEFSPIIVDQLRALPETDQVAGFVSVAAAIDGDEGNLAAFDSDTGTSVVNYGVVEGSSDLGSDGIAVFEDKADELGLALGDSVQIEFVDGFVTDLTVEAIFDDISVVTDPWIIDRTVSGPHVAVDSVGFVGVTYVDGVDPEAARTSVETVTDNYPQLTVQDNSEFQESVASQVGQLQIIVNALLVLCLVVAFFGIVNTMALSVLERIREIGLLRAVGMTQAQLKASVRWEAIIVSLFGAVLGVIMGVLFGWAAVIAVPDSFISKVGIPWLQLAIFLVVGGVIGVVAAYFPAQRAAKLDVLDAISAD